ncbi:unnamed protein product [Tenebrio molitor]|nr:unnamed protein product [Tenebrio molitor]
MLRYISRYLDFSATSLGRTFQLFSCTEFLQHQIYETLCNTGTPLGNILFNKTETSCCNLCRPHILSLSKPGSFLF